ncbi:Ig-like domain-containing protein [Leucobacter sp. HY1908]
MPLASRFPSGSSNYSIGSGPTYGTAEVNPDSGSLSYAPGLAPAGVTTSRTDEIVVRAVDAAGASVDLTLYITLTHSSRLNLSLSTLTTVEGEDVTLTAVQSSVSTNLSGSVTFYSYMNGSERVFGTTTLGSDRVASITTAALSAGQHQIYAYYEGNPDTDWAVSNMIQIDVTPAERPTVELEVAPATPVHGEQITVTATVTPAAAAGTVTYYSNGEILGSSSVVNGTSNFTGIRLPRGDHNLSAQFVGNSGAPSSNVSAVAISVAPAPTVTSVAATPQTTEAGVPIDLVATVSAPRVTGPGAETWLPNAGSVEFFAGGASLGSADVSQGVAMLPGQSLPVGETPVTATFSGSADYVSSASTETPVNVTKIQTATSLQPSHASIVAGDPLTITATVDRNTATGTVEFFADAQLIGEAPLTHGAATLTIEDLPLGTTALTAAYTGDATHLASSSGEATVEVAQIDPELTLSLSPDHPRSDEPVTLTAQAHAGLPTGTVTFSLQTTDTSSAAGDDPESQQSAPAMHPSLAPSLPGVMVAGEGPLIADGILTDGVATATFEALPAGDYTVEAVYGGDVRHAPATVTIDSFTVAQAPTLPGPEVPKPPTPTPPTPAPNPELPSARTTAQPLLAVTGAETTPASIAAIGLVAAALLLLAHRCRARSTRMDRTAHPHS